MTDPKAIKSVFGKELDLSALEGINMEEILRIEQDLLDVQNGDPNYVYGWMNTRDPACAIKLRKGLWQLVTHETDPEIISGGSWDDAKSEYRVNELVLVRMPVNRWKAMNAAITARAAHKEIAVEEQYRGRIAAALRASGQSEGEAEAFVHEEAQEARGRFVPGREGLAEEIVTTRKK